MKLNKVKKTLPYFAALGISCLLVKGMITQNTTYQQYLVEPTDYILSQVHILDQQDMDKRQQYYKWSKDNIAFVKNIHNQEQGLNEDMSKLPIIVKDGNSVWDKVSLFLEKKLAEINPEYRNDISVSIAKGKAVQFNRLNDVIIDEHGNTVEKETDKGIFVGIKNMEDKNLIYVNGLSKFFTEQQKYDYIFLHELSHYLSYKMLGNEQQNEAQIIEHIFSQFKKIQGNNGFVHSEEDKSIIASQYIESVADVLALELLYKKYPELDKNIPHKIAQLRAITRQEDSNHLNVLALENFENKNFSSLEDMLSYARTKALENTEFFSTESSVQYDDKYYSERTKEVKLVANFNAAENILKIRNLYKQADAKSTKKKDL